MTRAFAFSGIVMFSSKASQAAKIDVSANALMSYHVSTFPMKPVYRSANSPDLCNAKQICHCASSSFAKIKS